MEDNTKDEASESSASDKLFERHCKRYPWENFPYPVCSERQETFVRRRRHQLSQKFKDHKVISVMNRALELEAKKRATMIELLDCLLYRLEKGLPLKKEDSSPSEEGMNEIKKLREANDDINDGLKLDEREPTAAIVICWDGMFVADRKCGGFEREVLQFPGADEFRRNLDDLTMARCFETVAQAVEFCKHNCPKGCQVLSNPCTVIEQVHYEHE